MITTVDQYTRTKQWIDDFQHCIKQMETTPDNHPDRSDVHPLLWEASINGMKSKVADLKNQLLEFDLTQIT